MDNGDHSQRCISVGDKIRIKSTGETAEVSAVTSEYGPNINGVLLWLGEFRVRHLTPDIEKVCRYCSTTVMEFRRESYVQDE